MASKNSEKSSKKGGTKAAAGGALSEDSVTKGSASYGAKDIMVLEGLEPVRKRPGMYIGTTGSDGLHHLLWEVTDNSLDEAMAGYAKNITIELLPENKIAVTDDGRGIPVDIHPQTKKSTLETVLTILHAGGKFGGEGYKVSGGLHGVGVSVVNALSTWLRAEVKRDGNVYAQEYARGIPKGSVKKVGKAEGTGTKIIFSPDATIFSTLELNAKTIVDHLRQQAYLTKNVRINILDRRAGTPEFYGFGFEGGLLSFVKYLSHEAKSLQDSIFYVHKNLEKMEVEVAFLYTDELDGKELSFANNIYTIDGGMHSTGFRSALTRTLNTYARGEGYLKEKDENLTSEDTREGLVCVISVKLPDPQFEGQTKGRLGSTEARTAVEAVVNENLKEFLEKHPADARHIIEKVLLAARARKAAKAAKDTVLRKGALEGLTLPGKLADCTSRSAEESELYIVEGDSAGGCFSGDTNVALADGRNLSFMELVKEHQEGKQNFVYTIDVNGQIAIAPLMSPRRTKKNTQVVKILLDNDEEILCTPDHRFMLRDGSYREAQSLSTNDSLMPLYRKYSQLGGRITIEGYEMVLQPQTHRWIFTHMLADEYNLTHGVYALENGVHRHHQDFNKRNNNPSNILRISQEDHLQIHRTHVKKTLHRPDVLEKVRALHATSEFREKIRKTMLQPAMRRLLSDRAKKQWQNDDYKAFMAQSFMQFYTTNAEYREANARSLNQAQREYWSQNENRDKQSNRVRSYFSSHPEKKEELSKIAKEQWSNEKLLSLRAQLTQRQWTPEFRLQRKETYNQTYLRKALVALHEIYGAQGLVDPRAYDALRKETKDKSLLKLDTIIERFFDGNKIQLEEAVKNYNHRVKAVLNCTELVDVYDIEVPDTHNFALASGVFVHNSAKSGRDRRTQAILPLKGKILNVERARLDKMLANNEVRALVIALGTAIADDFDVAKLRYHKIILMSDADVDGAHIRTLLLTLFWRYFRKIIEGGYLYIAQPPLYQLQAGKTVRYAYTDEEKEALITEMQKAKEERASKNAKAGKVAKGKTAKAQQEAEEGEESLDGENSSEIATIASEEGVGENIKGIRIQRYKGLGEMNPEQLWSTTMDPANRLLKQVTIEDAEESEKLFGILMGDEVGPRKNFIQTQALTVKELDI